MRYASIGFLLAAALAGAGCAGPSAELPDGEPPPAPAATEAPTGTPAAPEAEAATPTPDAGDRVYAEALRALSSGDADLARTLSRRYLDEFPHGPRRAAAAAAADQASRPPAQDSEPLLLGAVLPLTGRLARYGQGARRAIELAERRHNAEAGAHRVRFRFEDSAGEPARAAGAAAALCEAGCAGMVGPLTGSELAACVQPALAAGVPIVAPAAGGRGAASWTGVFCVGVSPDSQGAEIRRLARTRRLRRLAVLHPRTTYGAALADALGRGAKGEGISVVEAVAYAPGQTDFNAEIVRLGGTDAKAARDEEEREKNFVQDRAESALAEVVAIVAPARAASAASPAARPSRKRKRTPSPTATPVPTPTRAGEPRPKVVVFDWVPLDERAEASNMDRKFGARLALLLRQQADWDVVGGAEFLRLAEQGGAPVDLEAVGAEDALLAAAGAQQATHVVSGSVVAHGAALALHTRVFDVGRRRIAMDLCQIMELPAVRPVNPRGLDAIVLAGRGNDVLLLASQLVFYDVRVPFLGTADWDAAEIARAGERALVGSVFPSPFYARSARREVREFVRAYGEAYAAAPDLWDAQAYDAAGLLLLPVALGARSAALLREELLAVRDHPCVTGSVTLAEAGDAVKRLAFLEVREGGSLEEVRLP